MKRYTTTYCDICGRSNRGDGAIFEHTEFEKNHGLDICEECHENGELLLTYDLNEEERRQAVRLGSMTTDLATCEWMWLAHENIGDWTSNHAYRPNQSSNNLFDD